MMDESLREPSTLTIPGYELREEIGRGGMGVVYRARDLGFERDVAIKVLGEKATADSFSAARFRNEARITGQLQHPGIPAAHELGALSDGKPFLAMKLVRGATLQAMLDQRSSPGEDRGKFIAIFEQICHAMGYVHAHQVIHRDLKPSNVMVGKFGEVQIMDWGLAKVLGESVEGAETEIDPRATAAYVGSAIETPLGADSATRTGSVLGTPAYMSPEQAGGQIRLLDARSDVFGLGAILCEILTGQPPYGDKNPNEVRIKAVRGDLQAAVGRLDACGAEPDLVALAKRCLAFKQEDRSGDGQGVADEVARIRTESEARAREAERQRGEAIVREAEGSKRRRQFLIAASVIGAVLVLGIIGTGYGLYLAQQAAGAEAKAKEDAKTKQKEAEDERKRAEQREQEAIDAVKRFGDAVAKNPELKNNENLEPLRKELLKEPLAFFKSLRERLQADESTRPESMERLANAAFELGNLASEIGHQDVAIRSYEEGLSISDRLVKENPSVAKFHSAAALFRVNLGIQRNLIGETAQALAALESAKATFERLVKEGRPSMTLQSNLALAYQSLGRVLSDTGKFPESIAAHNNAKRIREQLAQENPKVIEFWIDLAHSQNEIGKLFSETGRLPEAIGSYQAAKKILARLLTDNPRAVELEYLQANTATNIGRLLSNSGEHGQALSEYQAGEGVLLRLVESHPTLDKYRFDLATNQTCLGDLQRILGNFPAGLTAHELATASIKRLADENQNVTFYQSRLAACLNNLGITQVAAGKLAEAQASYETARSIQEKLVRDEPTLVNHHSALGGTLNNLALLLLRKEDWIGARDALLEAVKSQKRALDAAPQNAVYRQFLLNHYSNLILAAKRLKDEKLDADARKSLNELEASDPQLAQLDKRLNEVETMGLPKEIDELLTLSQQAYQRQRLALATSLYHAALEQDPTLAESREAQHAYNAACCAALAATGDGLGDAPVDDAAKQRFRNQALVWLKSELEQWQKYLVMEGATDARQLLAKALEHWLNDTDLSVVREVDKLAALPEAERKEWEGLWARVGELKAKAEMPLEAEAAPEDKK